MPDWGSAFWAPFPIHATEVCEVRTDATAGLAPHLEAHATGVATGPGTLASSSTTPATIPGDRRPTCEGPRIDSAVGTDTVVPVAAGSVVMNRARRPDGGATRGSRSITSLTWAESNRFSV